MNTTVYLIRHSVPFKEHVGDRKVNEPLLITNEKTPLSIQGEHLAAKKASSKEFNNIDVVYSSNYVRAMATAKYFASINNVKVNINEAFNERIHGVNSWEELPNDFDAKQHEDENYKIGYGESAKEVSNRMLKGLMEILEKYQRKRIVIVSHASAISYLLKRWCEIGYGKDHVFKNKIFFDGKWDFLETFKLEFNSNNELIDIKNIK